MERKILYLDNNIYSAIARNKAEALELVKIIQCRVSVGELLPCYSIANISEAPLEGGVLQLIQQICGNSYIDEKFCLTERDL